PARSPARNSAAPVLSRKPSSPAPSSTGRGRTTSSVQPGPWSSREVVHPGVEPASRPEPAGARRPTVTAGLSPLSPSAASGLSPHAPTPTVMAVPGLDPGINPAIPTAAAPSADALPPAPPSGRDP